MPQRVHVHCTYIDLYVYALLNIKTNSVEGRDDSDVKHIHWRPYVVNEQTEWEAGIGTPDIGLCLFSHKGCCDRASRGRDSVIDWTTDSETVEGFTWGQLPYCRGSVINEFSIDQMSVV